MYIKFYVGGHNITTSSDHNGALTSNLWVTDLTPMTPEFCTPLYSSYSFGKLTTLEATVTKT